VSLKTVEQYICPGQNKLAFFIGVQQYKIVASVNNTFVCLHLVIGDFEIDVALEQPHLMFLFQLTEFLGTQFQFKVFVRRIQQAVCLNIVFVRASFPIFPLVQTVLVGGFNFGDWGRSLTGTIKTGQ